MIDEHAAEALAKKRFLHEAQRTGIGSPETILAVTGPSSNVHGMATTIHLTSGGKIRVEDEIDVVMAKLAGPDSWIRLEETGGQPTIIRPDTVTHLTTTGSR